MKWIGNITALIVIFLFCSADGCTENSNMAEVIAEKRIMESKDSIRHAFEVNLPDTRSLSAYEETVKQKLLDFADHLKIASDSSLDMAFRQKAAEMSRKLFLSEGADIAAWNKAYNQDDIESVKQLNDRSLASGMSFWIKPNMISIKKPLTIENDTLFIGCLSFSQLRISYDQGSSPEIISGMLNADIYLIKRVKYFGAESLSIWEVFLGDIKTD